MISKAIIKNYTNLIIKCPITSYGMEYRLLKYIFEMICLVFLDIYVYSLSFVSVCVCYLGKEHKA